MDKLKALRPDLFKKKEEGVAEAKQHVPVIIKKVKQTDFEVPLELIENGQAKKQPVRIAVQKPKNIAFCFLTYRSIVHGDAWAPYIQSSNVYIHPKMKEEVSATYRPYIIPTLIETEWNNNSIVSATILLLKEAMKKTTNQWFVLCSEDSFPLLPFSTFAKYLTEQTLSIFNVMDASINKTSQWWAMRRVDVEMLLTRESEYNSIFQTIAGISKKSPSAPDELFFLNALKTFDPSYRFKEGCVHYVKWLPNVVSKHPVIFNRLLEEDIESIRTNKCLFIRKTFPTFQNTLLSKKGVCIIICVGTQSITEYDEFLHYARNKANVFVLSGIDTIHPILTKQCDQVYYTVWKQMTNAVEEMYRKFSGIYPTVYTLLEQYDYRKLTYPRRDAAEEWSFLYSQIEQTYRFPAKVVPGIKPLVPKPVVRLPLEEEPLPAVPLPVVPLPVVPLKPLPVEEQVVNLDEEAEEEEEPEPKPKTKTKKDRTKEANPKTRKIKIGDKSIANISPARYARFGSTPLPQRLPPNKIIKMGVHPMYMNNRKMFINLTNQMFKEYRDAGLDITQNVTCEDLQRADSSVSLLIHQQIIRDYMNLYNPYRGLLLYHGLGAGKTCSSIAIAEGLKTDKNVVVMTPASLNPNFLEELKKCGDEYYKKQQFWEWIEVDGDVKLRDTLSSILQLPVEYIDANRGAWVVDVTKPSNYDTINQASLNNQLDEMIKVKYRFINYNGLSTKKYLEMSSAKNPFDDKVVIIDEAHNLVSRIVNQLNSFYAVKQTIKKKGRELVPMAINIYKDLMSATNARIVLLSGTPIINYPNEIAVLFNILRGYIKTHVFTLSSTMPVTIETLKRHLSELTMLDYIEYNQKTLTITTNPFGYETLPNNQGVVFNRDSEHLGERQLPNRVKDILQRYDIAVNEHHINTFTALPDSLEDFIAEFIQSQENNMYEFKNPLKFKKRIVGLTSYFRSAQEELLPRYDKATDFNIVRVPMSDYQFSKYEPERIDEREEESKTKGKKKPAKNQLAPKDINKELLKESSSTFKIYSRLICNFATPSGFVRPKPHKKEGEAIAEEEDLDKEVEAPLVIEGQNVVEGEEEEADEYKQSLHQLMNSIPEDELRGEALASNSPKMLAALQNIQSEQNDGLHLIYSQFRTYEGIEMFSRVLKANGFAQFKIKKVSRNWVLNIAPEDMEKPKYALYTGTEGTEEREILRNVYNGSWKNVPKTIGDVLMQTADTNNMGQHIKVLMITAAGSEGINLFNTRFVHLIDPYWNNVRLEQVVGRARRICSHQSLPLEKQTVTVFLYLAVLTEEQYMSSEMLRRFDTSKLDNTRYFTSDETLYEIACIKEHLNTKLLHAVKEASIDCATHVNSSGKENLTCLSFGNLNDPTAFSYLPDIANDVSDEVYKQNVDVINLKDFEEITRKTDGLKLVRQKSTGIIYTVASFKRAQQTKNMADLIIFTD
jgi:hypothetical protein